jgi:RNA polymerase sigma factor FliA
VGKRDAAPRPAQNVHELWLQYQASRDPRLRDRLVLTLAPLVKYIVYRKVREIPARCEVEDFISCGLEALIKSLDRYDPARGTTLEQFVWARIHGAVLDEMRRNDWAPRSLRRWERDITQARERCTVMFGRSPSGDELAEILGISPRELDRHLQDIDRSDVGSLNAMVSHDDDASVERMDTLASRDSSLDPEYQAVHEHAVERFRDAFALLPERDRIVAVLRYVEGLTLREIGDVLSLTESRVCQIHGGLKQKLRVALREEEQLFAEVG